MAIAVGAHVTAHASTTPSAVTTTGVTTSASGSTFSIFVVWYGTGTAPTVTGKIGASSDGNTYTQVGSTVISSADTNLHGALYECVNGAGGATHTWTATWGGAQTVVSIFVIEVTGGLTSGIRDQAPGGNDDTASPYTSLTATTTQANELLLGYIGTLSASGTETLTWANGFTQVDSQPNANTDMTGGSAQQVVSATGTYQVSVTSAGAGTTAAVVFIVTYKAAAAAGLSSLGWQVPDEARPPKQRRLLISATPGTISPALSLGWLDEMRDPVRRLPPARQVDAISPVGTRIASALTAVGWLQPSPLQAPLGTNAARAPQPSAPTSPLVPFVSPSFAFGASTDLPRDTPLIARQVSEVSPVGALIPPALPSIGWLQPELPRDTPLIAARVSESSPVGVLMFTPPSIGWLTAEPARRLASPAPSVFPSQPDSPLKPFVSASTGWLFTDSKSPVVPPPRSQEAQQPPGPLTPFLSPGIGWIGSEQQRAALPAQRVQPTDPVGTLLTPQPFGWNAGYDQARPAPVVARQVDAVAPIGQLMSITLPSNGWLVTDNPRTPYTSKRAVVIDPVGNLLAVPPLPSFGWFQTDNPRTPYSSKRAVVVDPVGAAFPFLPRFGPYWYVDQSPRAPAPPARAVVVDPVGAPLSVLSSVGWMSPLDARQPATRALRVEPVQPLGAVQAQLVGMPWASLDSPPARVVYRPVEVVQPVGSLLPASLPSIGWMQVEQRMARFVAQRVDASAPVGSLISSALASIGWLVPETSARTQTVARVLPTEPVGLLFAPAPPASAAPWAYQPQTWLPTVPRVVYSVEPVGVLIPPPVFTSIAWMDIGVVRVPDRRHIAEVVNPVGDRLPPERPLLPAPPAFTARVLSDEYIAYVRFDTLEIRRQ